MVTPDVEHTSCDSELTTTNAVGDVRFNRNMAVEFRTPRITSPGTADHQIGPVKTGGVRSAPSLLWRLCEVPHISLNLAVDLRPYAKLAKALRAARHEPPEILKTHLFAVPY